MKVVSSCHGTTIMPDVSSSNLNQAFHAWRFCMSLSISGTEVLHGIFSETGWVTLSTHETTPVCRWWTVYAISSPLTFPLSLSCCVLNPSPRQEKRDRGTSHTNPLSHRLWRDFQRHIWPVIHAERWTAWWDLAPHSQSDWHAQLTDRLCAAGNEASWRKKMEFHLVLN